MNQLAQKKERNNKTKSIIFTVFIFSAFAALVYLFPYSGDDWAWGSQIGLDRLAVWFKAYNGRYFGNLLELALTRSELLNMVVTAAFLVGACLLPKLYSGSKDFSAYVMGTALFLLMPKEIFVQSIAWTAGFSNYVPPIVLTMLYFVIVRNIFEEEKPTYRPWVAVISAVAGFSSTLFMENVTLFVVAISALIVLYCFIRFKKVFLVHVVHFISSVIGALVMFTNSAYRNIANGKDEYRETAVEGGIVDTIVENSKEIFECFFSENITALVILSVLCAVLWLVSVKKSDDRVKKLVSTLLLSVNVLSLMIIYFKSRFVHWELFIDSGKTNLLTTIFFVFVAGVYFVTVSLCVFICIKCNKAKFAAMLLLISIPVLIAPLAVVTPIGPRCFFPPYLMLMGVCVLIFVYLKDEFKWNYETEKGVTASLLAVCLAGFIFAFSIYSTIHTYDVKRNEYVRKQVDAGITNVIVCQLPYNSYVWTGNPDKEPWGERYKLFYGIDEDVTFEFVSRGEFNEFVKNFEE